MRSSYLTFDGLRYCIHSSRRTSGFAQPKTVFALHGFGGCGLDFAPIASTLSKTHWYAPDFLGHGQSDCPKDERYYSLDLTLSALKRIHDHLGIKKSILLGYSMGGRVALHMVHRYPKLFQALILIGSSPGIMTGDEANERVQSDYLLADKILKVGIDMFQTEWSERPLISTQKNIPTAIKAEMDKRRQKNHPLGLANTLRQLGTGTLPSLWNELVTIELPVYLVVGENDKKFMSLADEMSKRLPLYQVIKISDAGHAAHLENIPVFLQFMKELLDTL